MAQGWHNDSVEHALAARGIQSRFNLKAHPRETAKERQARFQRFICELDKIELDQLVKEVAVDEETWTREDVMMVKKRISSLEQAMRGVPTDVVEQVFRVMKGQYEPTEKSIRVVGTGFKDVRDEDIPSIQRFLMKMPKTERIEHIQILLKAEMGMRIHFRKIGIQEERKNGFQQSPVNAPQFASQPVIGNDAFGTTPTLKQQVAAGTRVGNGEPPKKKVKRKKPVLMPDGTKSSAMFPMTPDQIEEAKAKQRNQTL